MRLNFVIVYEHDGKYIAMTDSIVNVESSNLKYQFERMCSAGSFTGGKPYAIQYCASQRKAYKLCEEWNNSYIKNGTALFQR